MRKIGKIVILLLFITSVLINHLVGQLKLKVINDYQITFGSKAGWFFTFIYDSIDNSFIVGGAKFSNDYLSLEAAVGKFRYDGKITWVVIDSGLNGNISSASTREQCILLDSNVIIVVQDKTPDGGINLVLSKINEGKIIKKKKYDRENTNLTITRWRDNVVGVEWRVSRNAKVVIIDRELNKIGEFEMGEPATRFVSQRVLGDTIYVAGSSGNMGTYISKYNLLDGKQYWRVETPAESTFQIFMDIDRDGNAYGGGDRMEGGHQKFFLYKVSTDGVLLWYKEWYPEGKWRLNYGNWLEYVKTYDTIVVVVGQVEKQAEPLDPNHNSAYLALFHKTTGEKILEEIWNYKENSTDIRVNSDNLAITVYKDTFFLLGYSYNGPITTWTYGHIRIATIEDTTTTPPPSDTTGTQPPDTTKPSSPPPLPTSYALYVYPNPFNGVATIRYEVPVEGEVVIMITDVLGRKIKEIKEVKTPNVYEIKFDANNLPSGVYVCRMRAGSFIQTRKMVLVK